MISPVAFETQFDVHCLIANADLGWHKIVAALLQYAGLESMFSLGIKLLKFSEFYIDKYFRSGAQFNALL